MRLGLGCAGLMRLSRRRDRRRLLDAAFDAGLRHFDVARMYGLGMAEGELGRFLSGRRDEVSIATKFGIDPPSPTLARLQAPARAAMAKLPALRRAVKRRDSAFHAGGDLSPAAARASLEKSLVELGVDHVDLFFLHEPGAVGGGAAAALGAELESLRAEGKIRAWGGAGEPAPVRALTRAWPGAQAQWREDVFAPVATGDEDPPAISFGVLSGAMPRIAAAVTDPAERRRRSGALGIDLGDPEALAQLLLREALDRNRRGGVLFATTKAERLPGVVAAARAGAGGGGDEQLDALRDLVAELRTGASGA